MENIELITRATALFMILLALALAGRAAETLARAEGIGPLESGRAALVETAEVKREQVTETVTAFGVVAADPNSQFVVATLVEGQVKKLNAYKGQVVEAGEEIAEIEPGPPARAQFEQLKTAVTNAEQQLEHVRRLFAQQLATRDLVASAEQALADAKAKLQAQEALGAGNQSVILRSPKTGIITNLSVQLGAQIAANTAIVEAADRGSLMIQLGIEPSDAAEVKPGDRVQLEHLFEKGQRIPGEIASVGAIVDPATRLLDALVHVTGTEAQQFAIGETVKATVAREQTEILTIPRAALLYEGDQPYVFIVDAGHAHRQNVTLGDANSDKTWVKDGLQAGQHVAVSGNLGLADGAAVRKLAP